MHILFYCSFANSILFFVMAIYVAEKVRKSKAAMPLLLLYLSFSVWCLGSAFFNVAETKEQAFFWYDVSSIGWIFFPALSLHFFKHLAYSFQSKKHEKRFMSIYSAPVLLLVLELFFHQNLLRDELVQSGSGLGWAMTISVKSPFYYLYILYVIVCISVGIFYVRRWGNLNSLTEHKVQSRNLFLLTALVLLAGFSLDLFIPVFSSFLPPVSNVVLFFLFLTTALNLKKYDIFKPPGFVAYTTILNTLDDPVILFDEEYKFFSISKALTAMLSYTIDDLKGKQLPYILKNHSYNQENAKTLSMQKFLYDKELILVAKNGLEIPAVYSASVVEDARGDFLGYILCLRDISMRITREKELIESTKRYKELIAEQYVMANFDLLTGLPNRRSFFAMLEERVKTYKKVHEDFTVLYMDLNGFKDANDTYGHLAGDIILKETADRGAFAARMGGDEFVILYPACEMPDGITGVIKGIKELIDQPFLIQGTKIHIGIAIGYKTFSEMGEDTNNLMGQADLAMYEDKLKSKAKK